MQKQETWDDLSDPWEGDATIDYWIWRDDGLVPMPNGVGMQEDERSRHTLRRTPLHARNLHAARRLHRQRNMMYAPLMGCPPLVIPWLLARHASRRVADKEGAHAKRTVTR
jgi:hypothetical protein